MKQWDARMCNNGTCSLSVFKEVVPSSDFLLDVLVVIFRIKPRYLGLLVYSNAYPFPVTFSFLFAR